MAQPQLNDILVVCDVDGTLLQAGYGIPQRNLTAIENFTRLGGHFTLATGRGVESVGRYTDWIALTAPAILCNGGILYDYAAARIIEQQFLGDGFFSVVEEVRGVFPDTGILAMSGKKNYITRMNYRMLEHTELEHIGFVLTDIEALPAGVNKILFADEPENIDRLKSFADTCFIGLEEYKDFSFVRTNPLYYEVLPKHVSKAEGLKEVAALLGIAMENTVAIGDFYNDILLLSTAGYSAVVAEAPDEVKKHADTVVSPCLMGGVADVLEGLIEKYA